MKQKKIIIILVSIIVFLGLLGATYVLTKKYWAKPVANLVNSDNNGLPGKLFGPITNQKAISLDPAIVLKWTNQYRADNGLATLAMNDLLVKAAQNKTDDMFKNQYFEHVSPSGVTPAQVVTSAGYKYNLTGENLALGDFKDEKDLVDAWMNSPGHRANILNKDFTEIGIATGLNTFEDRGKTWLAVQEFGKPLADCSNPDNGTLSDIDTKKAELDSLNSQVTALNADASNLNSQANEKIQKGNEIYTSTSDKAQAQPYWDEGTVLRTQSQTKLAQAQTLQTQSEALQKEIQQESDSYNTQVNTYNACIAT